MLSQKQDELCCFELCHDVKVSAERMEYNTGLSWCVTDSFLAIGQRVYPFNTCCNQLDEILVSCLIQISQATRINNKINFLQHFNQVQNWGKQQYLYLRFYLTTKIYCLEQRVRI